jgi:xanthosine utilization system XapX-like protein
MLLFEKASCRLAASSVRLYQQRLQLVNRENVCSLNYMLDLRRPAPPVVTMGSGIGMIFSQKIVFINRSNLEIPLTEEAR